MTRPQEGAPVTAEEETAGTGPREAHLSVIFGNQDARPLFPVGLPECRVAAEGAKEPAPDHAPRTACRAPVTYFRVICRQGVFPLAVGEAIGAEPSGCVESAAAPVEGRGFPFPRPSSALHSLPGTAARSGWSALPATAVLSGLKLEQGCGSVDRA